MQGEREMNNAPFCVRIPSRGTNLEQWREIEKGEAQPSWRRLAESLKLGIGYNIRGVSYECEEKMRFERGGPRTCATV